jgi:hypothetical protein
MERLTLKPQPKLNIPLWGLIHENRYADNTGQAFGCLFSKSHFIEGQRVDGLLLFTSPLQAEIYRLRLQALGNSGWRRFCTEDSDIENIFKSLREERLQLWIVAGFAASEMRQLLLDENQLLMTSSIGIDVMLRRDEGDDGAALRLPSKTVHILQAITQEVYTKKAGALSLDALKTAQQWSANDEDASDERAVHALERVSTLEYADYQKIWGAERPAVALAQYDQIMREWLFFGAAGQRH